MTELFDIPDSPSPKLKWMRAHGVITFYSDMEPAVWFAGLQEWHPEEKDPYNFFGAETSANGDLRMGEGDTEEEAIISLCQKHGLTHYSLS